MIYAVYVGESRKAGFTTREAAVQAAGAIQVKDSPEDVALTARIVEEPEYVTPAEAAGCESCEGGEHYKCETCVPVRTTNFCGCLD